jgi:protein-tyrosine phosphatase
LVITARHVKCDGAFNVRDLGGYPTGDGGSVRWRTIYRADGLHRITPESLGEVRSLGWRTVLDLRTLGELDSGVYADDGVQVLHLPMLGKTWSIDGVTGAEDAATFLADRYVDMLATGRPAIAAGIEVLATAARLPAVFHCSAGKDRTGVLAALLLSMLGVSDDVIADDYHLSAAAMERLVAALAAENPEVADRMVEQPDVFRRCPPEAMHLFLQRLRERYGSVDLYLLGAGVPPAVLTRARETLLERE